MKAVDRINKETALDFATQAIAKGCTITTDGFTVYPQLKKEGYTHDRVVFSAPRS